MATHKKKRRATPPWREEKILLVRDSEGFWRAVPGQKVLSPGQTVVWMAIDCKKLELDLPAAAFSVHAKITPGADAKGNKFVEARATVTATGIGTYPYTAKCDGQLASGGSSPQVIIDP